MGVGTRILGVAVLIALSVFQIYLRHSRWQSRHRGLSGRAGALAEWNAARSQESFFRSGSAPRAAAAALPMGVGAGSAGASSACLPVPRDPNNPRRPFIASVSPILPEPRQTIVIKGTGFGDVQPGTEARPDGSVVTLACNTSGPSLSIRDRGHGSHSWSSGRRTCDNIDAIGVRLVSWKDTEIVLAGFGAALGPEPGYGWHIGAGDPIEVMVMGPGEAGEGVCRTSVVSGQSR
jgi:hypothetical protein